VKAGSMPGWNTFWQNFTEICKEKDFSAVTSDEKSAALSLSGKLMQKRLRLNKRNVQSQKQKLFLKFLTIGQHNIFGKH
jgi:hypothetical protein